MLKIVNKSRRSLQNEKDASSDTSASAPMFKLHHNVPRDVETFIKVAY